MRWLAYFMVVVAASYVAPTYPMLAAIAMIGCVAYDVLFTEV